MHVPRLVELSSPTPDPYASRILRTEATYFQWFNYEPGSDPILLASVLKVLDRPMV
jgi:hypothetical protein